MKYVLADMEYTPGSWATYLFDADDRRIKEPRSSVTNIVSAEYDCKKRRATSNGVQYKVYSDRSVTVEISP